MSISSIIERNLNHTKQYQSLLLIGLVSITMTACSASLSKQSEKQLSFDVSKAVSFTTNNQQDVAEETQSYKNTQVFPLQVSASMITQDSQKQAVQVIRHYYNAINHQDYKSAYLDWSNNGAASQQSFEQFSQGFKDTLSVKVDIGEPGRLDGAAGSSYIEIPVTITSKTVNGKVKHFKGSYTLRRINDIPGSTLKQRMWHIYSAKITQIH
ncbi:hypothetical protein NIES2109_33820 [Nostoc sp. HK-01]|nr:hypothetical protein NIES2109_33820 [Nostoc sp. HK-01]